MISSAIVYRIAEPFVPALGAFEDGLQLARFAPCTATQERSAGWIEPRGEANGPLVESVGGQWIARFMVEAQSVPASVIKREVQKRAAEIEKATGRKPGRKETKELKEDAMLALLPMAFAKESATTVWVDPNARLLVIGAGSQSRADEVVSRLVEALPGLSVALLYTNTTPVAAMSDWLVSQEPPAGFSIDRECELKACDESKAVVKYGHHPLDIDEVRQHIEQGKLPTRLAVTWDERVSFVLTEGMEIKKITFLDGVFDGTSQEKEDGFDADVAITTGELLRLIPDLIAALGGEVEKGEPPSSALPGGAAVAALHGLESAAREGGHTMSIESSAGETLATFGDGPDPMYDQALAIVREQGKASISLVQRNLRIGYNRAARLLEAVEQQGRVSAMAADGQRSLVGGAPA